MAISNIDWVITSISNKDVKNRYLIIEEKIVSGSEQLLIGLGEARSLKEVKQDIAKENIPIFIIFVKNEDVSLGVWLYNFNPTYVDNKKNWYQIGRDWYVNVKEYSEFYKENELVDKLLKKIGSKLL